MAQFSLWNVDRCKVGHWFQPLSFGLWGCIGNIVCMGQGGLLPQQAIVQHTTASCIPHPQHIFCCQGFVVGEYSGVFSRLLFKFWFCVGTDKAMTKACVSVSVNQDCGTASLHHFSTTPHNPCGQQRSGIACFCNPCGTSIACAALYTVLYITAFIYYRCWALVQGDDCHSASYTIACDSWGLHTVSAPPYSANRHACRGQGRRGM